jgi:hypothetical protein
LLEETALNRIAVARERYEQLVDGLPAGKLSQLSDVLTSRQADYTIGDDGWTVECPACGFDDAWLSWETELDSDEDGTFTAGLALLGLDCPRCRLSLDDSEVVAAEIDVDDPREPDYET